MSATELVRACVGSADPENWNEFVARFQPTIAGVALRTARLWGETSLLVVEDLVQEIFLKLCAEGCRMLREFEPRHERAIYGYLKVVSANVVHDYFRKLHTEKRQRETPIGELAPEGKAGDREPERRMEREALIGEIERRLEQLPLGPAAERDLEIFWLYYRAGMSARAIAELPGIGLTIKGVESAIFRLTRMVRAELAGSGPEVELAAEPEEIEETKKGKSTKERLE